MRFVNVSILPVGQGMANLIEEYDENGQLASLVLLDCGGDSINCEHVKRSIYYLLQAMKKRADVVKDGSDYYLDIFVLSHQDMDHHALFLHILKKIKEKKKVCHVEIFYHFDPELCNCSDKYIELEEYLLGETGAKDSIAPSGSAYSNQVIRPFFRTRSVQLRRLYANASGEDKENSVSVVTQAFISYVEEEGYCVLFPGDATSSTMHCINELFITAGSHLAMSAPHHGSFTTTNQEELSGFLQRVKPDDIIVSAGDHNQYGHPHISFVNTALEYVGCCEFNHPFMYNNCDGREDCFMSGVENKYLYTSFVPDISNDGDFKGQKHFLVRNKYYHYRYEMNIEDVTFIVSPVTPPPLDMFNSSFQESRTDTKYWRAAAVPGMAERR